MAKNNRFKIKLVSSANTHFFYTSTKSKKNNKLLKIKKYDPIIRKHVFYIEKKIK